MKPTGPPPSIDLDTYLFFPLNYKISKMNIEISKKKLRENKIFFFLCHCVCVVLLDCTKFVLEFMIHFQQLLSEMPQSFHVEQILNVRLL